MSLFPEEQLDSPVGYFPAQLGQTLKDGHWTITRKLGWGPRSSTWLIKTDNGPYKAVKILTAAATEDPTGKNERSIVLGLAKDSNGGIPLIESFYESDTKGKRHLCLVFDVLSSSVEDLRLTNAYDGECLPVHIVQKVVGNISERLANLADQKIVHGAVTADNFLFGCGVYIPGEVAKHKSERAEKIVGDDGVSLYLAVKSQPMPHGCAWDGPPEDIMHVTFYLINYAYAHPSPTRGAMNLDTRKNLLPPEALLGERVDVKSDVWMLGCTTYLLLTGSSLFSDSYIASPIETATETLGKLESLLTKSGNIAEKDITPTASFLRWCLAIKPAKRASAAELVHGDWAKKTTACSCGWDGH